jgi:phospholipase/carboxylesterase
VVELDGPRLPATTGKADALVVLLHGYGADGADLIGLAHEWKRALPRAAFVAPNAPEEIAMSDFGRQWFALTFRDPTEYWRGVQAAEPILTAFIEAELRRLGLAAQRLVLVGFSQGTMMALHLGVRRQPPPAAIIGYSGMLAGPEHLAAASGGSPPVLLVHGEDDDLIPVEALEVTREVLAQRGYATEWHRRPGLGHGIDPTGVALGRNFLTQVLGS